MSILKEKVALISGAFSGIGTSTATYFAARNFKLTLTGLDDQQNLHNVVEQCRKAGAQEAHILAIIGDISLEEDVKRIVKSTIERYGRLDVLVNNAGILVSGGVENVSLESFDEIMKINVRAVFVMTQLALPHLKKTKGNIVNVSSVGGIRSFQNSVAYGMSKAALDQFTRCTALDVAKDGVRVNSVNPGFIATEIHKRAGMSESDYVKFLERSKKTHALGRVGTADEVVQAIGFLASESSASFITGVNLLIDGGKAVMCPW